jgi:hypothetical protein
MDADHDIPMCEPEGLCGDIIRDLRHLPHFQMMVA